MTWLDALILGVVEGITEFLPVSSTGHLVLAAALLGLDDPGARQAVDAFIIAIQGGAILAVLGLYRGRVAQMIRGVLGRDPDGRRLAVNLAVAFAPAALLGPLVHDPVERVLMRPWPVVAALAAGGALMIALGRTERREAHGVERLTWRGALVIGCLQCVSMWPGVSRSMATIAGGIGAGLRRRDAAEFSFLLGLPTLSGACAYRVLQSMLGGEKSLTEALGWPPVAVGFVTATASAWLAVRWLVAWLNRRGLAVFGWYRVALAIVFALLAFKGLITVVP